MKITSLMENTSQNPDILFEHGLSLYIEADGKKILFDSGQSSNFIKNAKTLGIDLRAVDIAILSHGHYDHGGGLLAFLEINQKAPIYIREEAALRYYNSIRQADIGLDKRLLENNRLHFTNDVEKLSENMVLYSCNEKERPYPSPAYGLCKELDGKFVPDDFLHEQYLEINEGDKRVLISGCSHKGILNIAHWFKPDVLVGGFHLMKLDPETEDGARALRETAEALLSYPTKYFTCHCTGEAQFKFLKTYMENHLDYLSSGQSIVI